MMRSTLPPSNASHHQRGLLVVGHGTRETQGQAEFRRAAEQVASLAGEVPCSACFLEHATPTIAEGVARLAAQGVEHLVVAPLLLFAAGHARRDVPAAVEAARREHPGLKAVEQSAPLESHPLVVEISALRYAEAVVDRRAVEPADTALVLVGRGSRELGATTDMLNFSQLRREQTPVALVETAFVAMAEPPLESVLAHLATLGLRRIVVQPHLLFGGVLVERIAEQVEQFAVAHPSVEWITTRHLGPAPQVARAVLERAGMLACETAA